MNTFHHCDLGVLTVFTFLLAQQNNTVWGCMKNKKYCSPLPTRCTSAASVTGGRRENILTTANLSNLSLQDRKRSASTALGGASDSRDTEAWAVWRMTASALLFATTNDIVHGVTTARVECMSFLTHFRWFLGFGLAVLTVGMMNDDLRGIALKFDFLSWRESLKTIYTYWDVF